MYDDLKEIIKTHNTIISVDVSIEIVLGNNKIVKIPLQDNKDTSANYVQSIQINRELSVQGDSLAVVSSDNITLEMISNDKSLLPENKDSEYFGYMNDQAYLTVYCLGYTYEDINGTLSYFDRSASPAKLGVFFVSSWIPTATTEELNSVTITAHDILSDVQMQVVPNVILSHSMTLKQYYIAVIDAINKTIENEAFKIKYREEDINFGELDSSDVALYNLDLDNFGNLSNNISQATLTNIYIDNEGYLKTDRVYDDTLDDTVSNINEDINITDISLDDGNLVGYNAVEVKYPTGKIEELQSIFSNNNQEAQLGLDVTLSQVACRVHAVSAICGVQEPSVLINNYNPKSLNIDLESDAPVSYDVIGKPPSDTLLRKIKLIESRQKSSTLSLVNRVINKRFIDKYIDHVKDLIERQSKRVTTTGYFNPLITISSNVLLNALDILEIEGLFKVVGIELNFGEDYSCNLTLLKYAEVNKDE